MVCICLVAILSACGTTALPPQQRFAPSYQLPKAADSVLLLPIENRFAALGPQVNWLQAHLVNRSCQMGLSVEPLSPADHQRLWMAAMQRQGGLYHPRTGQLSPHRYSAAVNDMVSILANGEHWVVVPRLSLVALTSMSKEWLSWDGQLVAPQAGKNWQGLSLELMLFDSQGRWQGQTRAGLLAVQTTGAGARDLRPVHLAEHWGAIDKGLALVWQPWIEAASSVTPSCAEPILSVNGRYE